MAINFPTNPALNDTYVYEGKTWQWNGNAWDIVQASLNYNSVVNGLGYPPLSIYGGQVQGELVVTGNFSVGTANVLTSAAGKTVLSVSGSSGSYVTLGTAGVGLGSIFADTNFGINGSTGQLYIINSSATADIIFQNGTSYTERMRIDNAGRVTMPYQPSFHAYGLNAVTSGNFVIYTNTQFNVGNHYSTTTGRFTAPVAGYYMFGWTAIGSTTNDVHRWRFAINGTTVGDIHLRQDTSATGTEYADNGMFVIPWYLNAADYVSIYYVADAASSPYGTGTATDYARFWGHLIG